MSRWSAPWRVLRTNWAVTGVLILYGASALVVPTLAPVAVNDDFLYARSAEILASRGELRIFPESVSTLVLQVGWGAIWVRIFGASFGVLRASTVTFWLLAGWAMYGLCRQLGVERARSALGAAIVLFNPLAYALSFTFMSDAYLTGLVIVSTWCFVRGFRDAAPAAGWVLLGSAVASMAFLVRQPGALVPLAILTWLLVSRRLTFDRAGVGLVARVALLPAVTVAGYALWVRAAGGASANSGQVADQVAGATAGDLAGLAHRLMAIEAIYLGFFVLPLAVAALLRLPSLWRGWSRLALLGALVLLGIGATAFSHFDVNQGRYPWAPQFLSDFGAGPADLRGGRSPLLGPGALQVLLVVCALSAVVFVVAVARRTHLVWERGDTPGGLVAGVLVWQAIGVAGPSIVLRNSVLTFDRYLLPLLPLGLALTLWALRKEPIMQPAAWAMAVLLAISAVASTRDHLVRQGATWALADGARASGIPLTELDGGAAWDGTRAYGLEPAPPSVPPGSGPGLDAGDAGAGGPAEPDGNGASATGGVGSIAAPVRLSEHDVAPWWLDFYAPAIEPGYIVSGEELYGSTVVRRVEISSWLDRRPTYLYLLRNDLPRPR